MPPTRPNILVWLNESFGNNPSRFLIDLYSTNLKDESLKWHFVRITGEMLPGITFPAPQP